MTGINQYFKLKSQSQVSTKPSEINFEAEAQEKFNKWRLRYKGGALSMNVTIAMRELLFEVKVAKLVYYMGDTELDEYFTMKISFWIHVHFLILYVLLNSNNYDKRWNKPNKYLR